MLDSVIEHTVEQHTSTLKRHEEQLQELIRTDAALAADIKMLQSKIDSGFFSIKEDLAIIRDKAFDAVPQSIAASLQMHSFVWQILGVIAGIGVAAVTLHHYLK